MAPRSRSILSRSTEDIGKHSQPLKLPLAGKKKKRPTFQLGPRTIKLPQRDDLPPDLTVLVHQDRRRVLVRISLNAHVPPDLAELDIPVLGRQLAPELRQHPRLGVPVRRRGQMHQDEVLRRRIGHFARVVDFLDGVYLVVDAGLLEGGELCEAFLAAWRVSFGG